MKRQELGFFLVFVLITLAFSHVLFVGAITWSAENRLTTHPNTDLMPSIAQTSDNKIWIIWEEDVPPGRAIFYTTSSDYGISWAPRENITKVISEDMNTDPSIIQLSNGTIMVVWSAIRPPPPEPGFDLSAAPSSLSIPRGSSNVSIITVASTAGFSDQVDLSAKATLPPSPFIDTDFDPNEVTPPPNGNANSTLTITVGALTSLGDYTIVVTGRSESLNVTETVNIALTVTSAMGSSTIAGASNTTPLSISPSQMQNDYEIYYKTSNDNGTSWSSAAKLTHDSADDKGPSIIQASNGTIWLVWSSKRTGNFDIFYKTSSDMGVSWSSAAQLTSDIYLDAFPAIAEMNDGRIWIAWHTGRYLSNGGIEILYNIYDGASWLGNERLTSTSKDVDDTCPAILQTDNETIWIFWASEGDYEPPFILYKKSTDNGDTWSGTLEFTTGLSVDKWPAATQTCDSKIWVVWASSRDGNFEIYYKTSFIHNVAVTDVIPSETKVYEEENVTVDVAIQNYGDYNETFTVNCYTNSTPIGSQGVNLTAKASDMVTFMWNTSGFGRGNYILKGNASSVDGETYTGDNTLTYENIRVKLLGDVFQKAPIGMKKPT